MSKNVMVLPPQQRGGTDDLCLRADTWNDEDGSVELVFSTGVAVQRHGWMPDRSDYGPWTEELSMEPGAVDLARMNSGAAPLLDSHYRWDMGDQLGVIVAGSARIEGGLGICRARFRDTEKALEVARGVKDGTVRNVSVGYRVLQYEVSREEGKIPVYRATRWAPFEVSAVPVGADAEAGFRAESGEQPVEIVERKGKTMANEVKNRAEENAPAVTDEVRAPAGGDDPKRNAPAPQAPAAPAADVSAVRAEVVAAERQRILEITDLVRNAGLDDAFARSLTSTDISVESAGLRILEKLAKAGEVTDTRSHVTVGPSNDDPSVVRGHMADALVHRHFGGELGEAAREYRGASIMELARELLEVNGVNIRRLRSHEIYERAMTTSDFPLLLQSTGDRMLLAAYERQDVTYRAIADRTTARDFRAKHLIRSGDFPTLLPKTETGEFKAGAMSESEETVKLETVGRQIMISREAMINDDLSAFSRLISGAAQAAAEYENEKVWGLITSNAKLKSDNVDLFHASHNNLASGGAAAAIGVDGISAGRTAMRLQKGLDAKRALNLRPAILAVSSAKETIAEQFLSDLVLPTKDSDITPASLKQLQLVVEPLLDAAAPASWYLFADPSRLATITYAYLEGQEGPQMREKEHGFGGMKFEVLLDFAAAVTDYRGAYKNVGA